MSSSHNALDSTFYPAIDMMTGADRPTAQAIRIPLERVHDNTAWLKANDESLETQARLRSAVRLRTLQRFGHTISDPAESLAAIQLGKLTLVIKANSDGVFKIGHSPRYTLAGALDSITGSVKGVASYSGVLFALGFGGVDTSSDAGATWTAAADPGLSGTRCRIVADPDNSRVIVSSPASTSVKNSIDGTSWTSRATGATGGVAALAQVPFATVALSESANTLVRSSNGGDSWSAATGFPANASSFDESGDIVGDYENSKIHHVARLNSGASLQISSGTIVGSNTAWTVRATLAAADYGLSDFGERPRVLYCPDTGLLVVVGRANGTSLGYAIASIPSPTVDAVTFGELAVFPDGLGSVVDSFAVAGGRLFAARDDQLFASDGV